MFCNLVKFSLQQLLFVKNALHCLACPPHIGDIIWCFIEALRCVVELGAVQRQQSVEGGWCIAVAVSVVKVSHGKVLHTLWSCRKG